MLIQYVVDTLWYAKVHGLWWSNSGSRESLAYHEGYVYHWLRTADDNSVVDVKKKKAINCGKLKKPEKHRLEDDCRASDESSIIMLRNGKYRKAVSSPAV